MMIIDAIILITGILVTLGIVSSKLSSRMGVPVLVLFLLLGMLAGSEGIGGIEFSNYELAYSVSTLALAIILFDAGLGTSMQAIHLSWKPSVLLATLGVLITAVITGLGATWILGISWLEGLLLGSIVGLTDAAAVFAVLRSGGVSLSKRMTAVLEVESASNDPMAIFMTIGCIEVLLGNVPFGIGLLGLFFQQMIIGAACGLAGGFLAVWLINRIELNATGMYPVLVSAFCLMTFGFAVLFKGSGFLAVYVAGCVIGNQRLVYQRGIRLFHDAAAWLSQIVLFVVLGLLCTPSRLLDVTGKALLISAVLIFVARPVAVFISAFPFRFTWKELSFISWVGLKGAVPITLATFPLMMATSEHSLQASLIFDVVFFIVVVSAVVQGSSLTPVARWLGVERPRAPEPPVTLEISSLRNIDGAIVDYAVTDESRAEGLMVKDLGLPSGAVIALIARGQQIIPPQGNTHIEKGDHVILVLRPGMESLVNRIFGQKSENQSMLPTSLEFPLRANTTVAAFRELYQIPIDAADEHTLAEAVLHELGKQAALPGDQARFGPIVLRVLRLDDNDDIEMVGMSILPEEEIEKKEH